MKGTWKNPAIGGARAGFFKRKEKDTDGIEKPMWRTR